MRKTRHEKLSAGFSDHDVMFYALECHQLSKSFDSIPVVQDVSIQIQQGEFLTLLGPSGCGKTTSLRLIAGFEVPDTGTIHIHGKVVSRRNGHTPAEQRRIGMVFQEYALFPHLSVNENIAFGLRGDKYQKAQRVKSILSLLELGGLGERMPYQLSGGQQQRVALARALAPEPQVLLLDEPFSNLDASLRAQVRLEVKKILKSTGITCVFVTHDQEEALSLSDKIVIMFSGRVIQTGTPQTIYMHPATRQVATFVGETNLIPAEAQGKFAVSVLGKTLLNEFAEGRVDLLIRPEMLQLDGNSGISATIQWIDYYGHDQRMGLILENGTSLLARAASFKVYEVGQVVNVSTSHAVQAFTLHPS